MKYYELATLQTVIFGGGKAAPGIQAWLADPESDGRLCGAWSTDIGRLNQVILLREFDALADLHAERERARRSSNPFGCGEFLVGLEMDSYAPLDFISPVQAGDFGPIYEIRTYHTKMNGLTEIENRWRDTIPERSRYSRLTVAMYGIDGGQRFTQIWPYRSLEERTKARAQSVADGAWPPKGGPDWLTPEMYSTIGLPMPFSPLQ